MHPADRSTLTLAELGVEEDPGTSWHPRADKPEARGPDGLLRDLTAAEVLAHAEKPEAVDQIDATLHSEPLAAEDSLATDPWTI